MKTLEIFGENLLKFIEKSKLIEIWWMISIGQVKLSNLPAKPCAFGQKMQIILKIFKKSLRFFWSVALSKIAFFTIFSFIFLAFLTSLRKYRPLEDNTRFLQQFFRFRGEGNVPAFPPPPDATGIVPARKLKNCRKMGLFFQGCIQQDLLKVVYKKCSFTVSFLNSKYFSK